MRWDRRVSFTKRQFFVSATVILTFGLMLTQLVSRDSRYPMVVGLSVLAFCLSAFVLREDLRKIEWLSLLTLPTLFTAAVALFYFLLPARWLTRVPVVALYAVGMYALLLTENIFNVAAERTIALLRAAHSVGFLITLITYFFLVQTILAFRLPFYLNAFLVGVTSFLLAFQTLWSVVLESSVERRVWHLTIVAAVLLGEMAWALSFWPTQSTLKVLFLTTSFYGVAGMSQQYLVEKLYKKNIVEFLSLCVIVMTIVVIATRWRGNL